MILKNDIKEWYKIQNNKRLFCFWWRQIEIEIENWNRK